MIHVIVIAPMTVYRIVLVHGVEVVVHVTASVLVPMVMRTGLQTAIVMMVHGVLITNVVIIIWMMVPVVML